MPTIPLSIPLLVVIPALSAVPCLILPPRAASPRARGGRLAIATLTGAAAGGLLGNSVLASGLSVPATVLVLLAATVLFAEGVAGRGWPLAGTASGMAYLAALLLDFSDRTGETLSWIVWPLLAAIALPFTALAQVACQFLRRSVSRPIATDGSPQPESDNSR